MIAEMTEDYGAVLEQWRDARTIVECMLSADKPVVSAINGVAVGAGLAVALMADISIMGESARVSDGHARLGVAAGDHAALLWPLLCGMAKAKYYLLTADFVTGPEAERIGLVTKCVADDDVVPEALAVARRLAAGSATAVQWTRRVMNHWLRQALPGFGESVALEMLGFLGPDAREGLAAIRERREPLFPSAPSPSRPGSAPAQCPPAGRGRASSLDGDEGADAACRGRRPRRARAASRRIRGSGGSRSRGG